MGHVDANTHKMICTWLSRRFRQPVVDYTTSWTATCGTCDTGTGTITATFADGTSATRVGAFSMVLDELLRDVAAADVAGTPVNNWLAMHAAGLDDIVADPADS